MPMFGGAEMNFSGLFPDTVIPASPPITRVLERTVFSLWLDSRPFFNTSISETL